MNDETEQFRREEVAKINAAVESDDVVAERKRLEALYGQVWNSDQLREDYKVNSFAAPYVGVTRRSDGLEGSLEFQHSPRFYFSFTPNS